ncbi:MAG: AraC family transcriptional regulator [Pseudomonadota bacterium]
MPPWLASEIFTQDVVSTSAFLSVSDELGPMGKSLVEEISNSSTVKLASEILIRFLCDRLKSKRHSTRREILWAWKRLSDTSCKTTIQALASDIGWSERHFSSKYSESIGCSPLRSAKLARFSLAYQALVDKQMPIAEVSALAGYYDQSHMYRDFREFAGLTPKKVRAQESQHLIVAQ